MINVYEIVDQLGPKSDLFKAIKDEFERLQAENEQLKTDKERQGQIIADLDFRLLMMEMGGM